MHFRFAVFTFVMLGFALGQAQVKPSKPVTVTNTPSVTVANTPSVNVANTPTVNVGNTPTVNVGNSVTVNGAVSLDGTPSVTLANATAASPLPTASVTSSPIDLAGYAQPSGNYGGGCVVPLYDVPAGMQLIVEQVSATLQLVTMGTHHYSTVYAGNGAVVNNAITNQTIGVSHFLDSKIVSSASFDELRVSQNVKLYVTAGHRLTVGLQSQDYGNSACWVFVSGHLETVQ